MTRIFAGVAAQAMIDGISRDGGVTTAAARMLPRWRRRFDIYVRAYYCANLLTLRMLSLTTLVAARRNGYIMCILRLPLLPAVVFISAFLSWRFQRTFLPPRLYPRCAATFAYVDAATPGVLRALPKRRDISGVNCVPNPTSRLRLAGVADDAQPNNKQARAELRATKPDSKSLISA